MYNFTITAPVSMFISLAALAGVTLHDTKIDKLATSLVGVPVMTSTTESGAKSLSGDAHTHVERVTLNENRTSQPRLVPRSDHRKHVQHKAAGKGSPSHDGYSLPLA